MSPRPPLLVNVAGVLRHLGTRTELSRTATLAGLQVMAARVPEGAQIQLVGVIESTASGAVKVTGAVSAPWTGECRRCLGPVEGQLVAEVSEVFEAHPIEGDTYPLVDEQIDLGNMVRDALLLALPLAPLCQPRCPGPDPEEFPVGQACEGSGGTDRPVDPRWAQLDQLGTKGPDAEAGPTAGAGA